LARKAPKRKPQKVKKKRHWGKRSLGKTARLGGRKTIEKSRRNKKTDPTKVETARKKISASTLINHTSGIPKKVKGGEKENTKDRGDRFRDRGAK